MLSNAEISDDELLYRRVIGFHVVNNTRISSGAFKDRRGKPENEISVDIAGMTTPEACLARAPNTSFRIGELVARDARELGFDVVLDPLPDNDAHALICGENSPARCRALAQRTRLII